MNDPRPQLKLRPPGQGRYRMTPHDISDRFLNVQAAIHDAAGNLRKAWAEMTALQKLFGTEGK